MNNKTLSGARAWTVKPRGGCWVQVQESLIFYNGLPVGKGYLFFYNGPGGRVFLETVQGFFYSYSYDVIRVL